MSNEPERRPVAFPSLFDEPEVPTRVPHTAASWLGHRVVRPAWLWRREIAVVLAPVVVGAIPWVVRGAPLADLARLGGGIALAGLLGGVLSLVPRLRSGVGRWLSEGRLRRKWDMACRFSRLQTDALRIPRITETEHAGAGTRVTVRLPKGLSTDDLTAASEKLAVVLDVRETRVKRDPARAKYPTVLVLDHNPFHDERGPVRLASPVADAARWSLWDGVPVGLDELGKWSTLRLVGRNLLLGGEPEAGKSVALGTALAAAALDPMARLSGLDAKQVELALWEPVMGGGVVYNDIDAAIDLLGGLIAEMDRRYDQLAQLGIRSVSRSLGWLVEVLTIDELRFFTAHPDKQKRTAFNLLLIDLVARGRAAGIIVLAATQKPSSDVVPTSVRDLFAYRWALRCTTRDASDTILGAGWATEGYSAGVIDAIDRGVGLLLAEGGMPEFTKAAYLDDDAIRRVVTRGVGLREVV
ncbi:hypothetical protein F4561_005079 [Lipingzhangella halophila]|uniref:FtsK domain-containing protein n=1 Tax=Lipingzhangella halophila TaxID=1783352 RepID=A0A7W7W5V8_9ACTN|nr:FtsK/SpoIIIE domain-containing protein [Lipingzhangella halophila]MBB4934259.1 hypothetical protein [Lipingzhangella halophila]